jgi:transcriptional regulator with XRE-family HTH domain
MNSGKTLKLLRVFRGVTQKQLGDRLRVSQQAISKMEQHRWIDSYAMKRIISALGCSREELKEIEKIISREN